MTDEPVLDLEDLEVLIAKEKAQESPATVPGAEDLPDEVADGDPEKED